MGGKRGFQHPRCQGCGLWEERCICDQRPAVTLPDNFGLVFVLHNRERHKPTNTGKIAHALLPGSDLIYYGVRDEPLDTRPLDDPDTDYYVLFPRDEAHVLGPGDPLLARPPDAPRRAALVVLDGTWHQCSRMSRRAERVKSFPLVALPPGPPGRWGVRTPHKPGYLCTLEAVIRALALLHGSTLADPLNVFFERLRLLMMAQKGRSPDDPASRPPLP